MDPDSHKDIRLNRRDLPGEYTVAAGLARAHRRIDWQGRYGLDRYQIAENPLYAVNALVSAGWDAPNDLLNALRERAERDHLLYSAVATDSSDDDEDPRRTSSAATLERNTMLKLIIGLACGGYGMHPDAEKNQHAKSMREDLERLGIPLDDGTIKKYLDEARQLRKRLTVEPHSKI